MATKKSLLKKKQVILVSRVFFTSFGSWHSHLLATSDAKNAPVELLHSLFQFFFPFRFCKRHADYLSPDFSIGARLPDHLEDRSNRFKLVLQQLIREKSFGPGQIGSMDELPLHLTPSIRDKRLGTTG